MSSHPNKPFLHLCDPRAKILALLIISLQILAIGTSFSLAISTIEVAVAMLFSGIRISSVAGRLKAILWFGIIFTLINSLTMSGEAILVHRNIIATKEGVWFGLELTYRLALLLFTSTIFLYTTPAQSILDVIETFGQKSKTIARPLVIILSLALSFSPLMVRSAQQIKQAHLARGVAFDSGWIRQIRFAASASLPLFASAFRSSQHLALAMESRGYNPAVVRTVFTKLRFQTGDMIVMAFVSVIFLLLIAEAAFPLPAMH